MSVWCKTEVSRTVCILPNKTLPGVALASCFAEVVQNRGIPQRACPMPASMAQHREARLGRFSSSEVASSAERLSRRWTTKKLKPDLVESEREAFDSTRGWMGSQVDKLARDSGIAYTSATGKAARSCAKTSEWLHWWMPLGLWRRFSWRARGDFSVLLGSSERADRRSHSKLSAWRVQISSTSMRLRSMSQFGKIQQTSNRSNSRKGDATISQREKVWDRGEVFSRPAAASQLRYLWDTANAERPSVDFSWPRFCWVPSKYELNAGCYNGKAKYEELQKAPSLHSTSSARWIKEAVFWHVSRLMA